MKHSDLFSRVHFSVSLKKLDKSSYFFGPTCYTVLDLNFLNFINVCFINFLNATLTFWVKKATIDLEFFWSLV